MSEIALKSIPTQIKTAPERFLDPLASVLRRQTIDETQGFMKALVTARDDRILGFTMIGAEAGEVVAVVQTAMPAGGSATPLFSNVPPRLP